MASLYWLEAALPGLLPTLWMSFGVGLPWALAALSVQQWRSRALVAAVALALGPAWVTAWMLALGVAGAAFELRLLAPAWILLGSGVIAVMGAVLAWRKRRQQPPPDARRMPLYLDEKLIIGLIVIAVGLRWIHTAFWPFTAYDALWVFGYQGRLFFLEGMIPSSIDYYPPFLSLQFAYVQILLGEINDHAARMALPLLHIGSILAAYLLGERLVNRRVGLFTAALWSLHPHVSQWAPVGDLEIPLSFSFTLAAVFFLRAWLAEEGASQRRRDAVVAGVMLGIALYTKPTAGAFVWGVLLMLALDLTLKRIDWSRWRPRLKVALLTGAASFPLGGVWYLRNLALGHEAVTFPKALWLTRALRSGDYLAPLVLALLLAGLAVAWRQRWRHRRLVLGALGCGLLLAGVLASNPHLFPARVDPPASYIQLQEAAAISLGLAFIGIALLPGVRSPISARDRRLISAGGWGLLLALPYFATFFFSYSYHYRLGFAIVPLLCLPSAMALAQMLTPERIAAWRAFVRRAYFAGLVLLAMPGVMAVAVHVSGAPVWLLQAELDSDMKKVQAFNPSLMEVVFGLRDYQRETGREPVVMAPGEERLPYFFPLMPIHDGLITGLAELEATGASHFVYGAKAREAYLDEGLNPASTQVVAALGREDLFRPVREHYDGTIGYALFEVRDFSRRFDLPKPYSDRANPGAAAVFGGRIELWTQPVYPTRIFRDTPLTFVPTWRALEPVGRDFTIELRLVNATTGGIAQDWQLRPAAHRHGAYGTSMWEPGEYFRDVQVLHFDAAADIPRGDNYVFLLSMRDHEAARLMPLTVDGKSAGRFYQLPGIYDIRT